MVEGNLFCGTVCSPGGVHPFWGWTRVGQALYFCGDEYHASSHELSLQTVSNFRPCAFDGCAGDVVPCAIVESGRIEDQRGPDDGKGEPETLRADDGGD